MPERLYEIYGLLQEITWCFGGQGVNGECCGDLSLVEFMALKKACETENVSIQKIGCALGFTKSGATRIVDRLEHKGYVARRRSSEDGRVCCLAVTAKGRKTVAAIVKKYTGYLGKKLKNLEPEQLKKVRDMLGILSKALH